EPRTSLQMPLPVSTSILYFVGASDVTKASAQPLQRADALFDRRVRREQPHDARFVGDAESRKRFGQLAGRQAAESRQCMHHRLRRAQVAGAAGVGAELTLAGEPGDDDACENAEYELAHDNRYVIGGSDAPLGADN